MHMGFNTMVYVVLLYLLRILIKRKKKQIDGEGVNEFSWSCSSGYILCRLEINGKPKHFETK